MYPHQHQQQEGGDGGPSCLRWASAEPSGLSVAAAHKPAAAAAAAAAATAAATTTTAAAAAAAAAAEKQQIVRLGCRGISPA